MRAVIQRVTQASVTIHKQLYSSIGKGLLILLGIEDEDNPGDIEWLCNKLVNLRIFADENNVMNLSIKDISGEFLIVSQFTLHASTKKGNRPSYIRAAKPEIAIPLYEKFIETLSTVSALAVKSGSFGANMEVNLLNDGPVTIIIDTKNKE
jgi:D-tyrosyl-tRNA(Tyr) deacylase